MNYLLCLDLETTGLDPNYHEIIQVGAVLLDNKLRELGEFSSLVQPLHPMRGINKGYNTYTRSEISPEELRKAKLIEEVTEELQIWLMSKGVNISKPGEISLLGQNIKFDYGFLEKAYEKSNLFFPYDYHAVDISSIYLALYIANEEELPDKITLHAITTELGIKNKQAHDALSDAKATLKCFRKLVDIVKEVAGEKNKKDKLPT